MTSRVQRACGMIRRRTSGRLILIAPRCQRKHEDEQRSRLS